MSAESTERTRRTRQRQAQGLVVYRLEANAFLSEEMLVEEGYLAAWDANDRRSVEAAIAACWADLVARCTSAEADLVEDRHE